MGAAAGWTESVENEDRYTSAGFHPALVARLWVPRHSVAGTPWSMGKPIVSREATLLPRSG